MDIHPELLNRPRTMLTRAVPLVFLALIRHFWAIAGCLVLVGTLTFCYDNFLRAHSDGQSHITFLAEPRVPEHTPPATLDQIKQWTAFTAELAQSAEPRLLSSSLRRFTSSRPSADLDITHGEATVTFTVSSRTPEIATKINNDIYAEFARVLDGVTKTNVLLLPMDYHSDPTVHHYWLTAKLIAMAFVLLLAAFFCKESSYYETIKDPADIKAAVDLPTLGLVTFRKDGVNLLKRGRQSEFADRYEILSYYAYSRCKGLRSILITSTGPEEGNSTVALNLATAVAWSGRKVVLLDGNCRRPSLHRLFHVSRTAGLADYLRSDVKLESIIVKTECAALDFIPAGGSGPDSGLIASRKCFELVRELEKHYDLVVIDSPPALSFPEPLLIAPLTQGCLLVVESGKTGATALCRTVENLRAANANVLGVVVNKLRFRLFGRAELESLDYYGQNRKPQETEEGTQRKRKA